MAYTKNQSIIYKKIKAYIKVLEENGFDIWRLYLFGSYAKHRFNRESDIDLAIFLNRNDIDGFEEDAQFMRLRRKVDMRIEPHSFAKTDFDKTNPFIREIVAMGKRII